MKKLQTILILTALALSLSACGNTAKQQNPDSKTDTTTSSAVDPIVSSAIPTLPAEQFDALPLMSLHYDDADARSSVMLTPSDDYIWTSDAQGAYLHSGTRPADKEGLCTITLADKEDEATLGFHLLAPYDVPAMVGWEFEAAKQLQEVSLFAYPVDDEGKIDLSGSAAQEVKTEQGTGKIKLLLGKYYYELSVTPHGQTDTRLTYGFIADRIEAEEYEVYQEVSGCLVNETYQDPDHDKKTQSRLHLLYWRSNTARYGTLADRCGTERRSYLNHAGTSVSMSYTHALGDPEEMDESMRRALFDALEIHYEHDILSIHPFDLEVIYRPAACTEISIDYIRYDYNGKTLDGKGGFTHGDSMMLEENSVYRFTVHYYDEQKQEIGSSHHLFKTGGIWEADNAPCTRADCPAMMLGATDGLESVRLPCLHGSDTLTSSGGRGSYFDTLDAILPGYMSPTYLVRFAEGVTPSEVSVARYNWNGAFYGNIAYTGREVVLEENYVYVFTVTTDAGTVLFIAKIPPRPVPVPIPLPN